ncbi:UPF0764 protein C16orf89 homolog isoform X2 [Mercenaria mercenaria]|uniref:UPF0764 protein C16orf89 homolog isoform X2 n=1 Tax=Mercenaria mercenaria TaxID=6596 RepID=UPI00234EDC9F|nr:UPF0764 protein C16orf89 homolog isoform X2 [Mercenaria mercenaria]
MRVVILTLLFIGGFAGGSSHTVVYEVLHSVEKALDFFADDYSAINVDGLFGLRLGQGQLREAIRECKLRSCDSNVFKKMLKLEKELDKAANSALPYVESEDSDYYERFLATIDKPYVLPYKPTSFEKVRPLVGYNSHYNEEKGDSCYARMLGTYVENGRTLARCNITHDCLDYMTTDETSDYFITHQLLYFIMVEHVGCKDQFEKFAGGHKLRSIQKDFCDKIYEESKHLSREGDVRQHRKDLFLEQTVLCGPLGFEDFMRPDWIKMVLSWPDKRLGCFRSNLYKTLTSIINSEKEKENSKEGETKSKQPESNQNNMRSLDFERSDGSTMRKLLREKQMKDGCLSHTSGLGFGVLCTYLRFLVRYTPMYML